MPFIILQRTPAPMYRSHQGVDLILPGLYVQSVSRRGELVLDDRDKALKFQTEAEAKKVIKEAGNPKGTEVQEMRGPLDKVKPSSPLGFILVALEEEGPLNLQELREKLPKQMTDTVTASDTLTLVKRVGELLPVPPPAVNLLLLQDHVRIEHVPKKKARHKHVTMFGGEDGDEIITSAKGFGHDHAEDINSMGKEVKKMATKTKTKGKKGSGNGRVKKEKVLHDCHCGCGGQTFSNFNPGHDARVYSLLKKEATGEKVKLPKVLTDNTELLASMRDKVH